MHVFLEKFKTIVKGVLSGWDRLRLQGTLRYLMGGGGVIDCMYKQDGCKLDQYSEWVQQKSSGIIEAAKNRITAAGRPLQYIAESKVSKEELARKIMERDGITKGTICGFTALEPARICEYRQNKGRPFLNYRYGKCLHIYHYLIHPVFGFMHVRLQTWLPFHLTLCINGREWLRKMLDQRKVRYEKADNCFIELADFELAQDLMDTQLELNWCNILNPLAAHVNPGLAKLFSRTPMEYYWSFQASEWATDIVFHDAQFIRDVLLPRFIDQSMKVFSCTEVARFLDKKLTKSGQLHAGVNSRISSHYAKRNESACVKFRADTNSLKSYVKAGIVLRTETTINDANKFTCPRKVTKRKRQHCVRKPLRKGVADSYQRAKISQATNARFLNSLAAQVDAATPFNTLISKVNKRVHLGKTAFRALRPFEPQDLTLLKAVANGTHMLKPFRNATLRQALFGPLPSSEQERLRQSRAITARLRMLRAHGIIAKVPHSRTYLLTTFGHQLVAAVLAAISANTEQLLKLAA